MKKLTIFHLINCPYCVSAREAVKKLQSENPEYAAIKIDWQDENKITEFPKWCNYYYVPTIYYEEKKLYEAHPGDSDEFILENVKNAFDTVLK